METMELLKPNAECPPVMVLARSWNMIIKAIYGFERQMGAKEFGQLKTLRSRLGKIASEVMGWTLNNWHGFSLQAREEAGLPCTPPTPHIGFLLAHHDTARRMWLQSVANENAIKQKELSAQPKPETVASLSHGAAWSIYLKTETPKKRAQRLAIQYSYFMAEEALNAAPHDADVQAKFQAAKNAFDEHGAAEEKALKELGWDGKTC